jgi:hypothetical protein
VFNTRTPSRLSQRLQRAVAVAHAPPLNLPFDSDAWASATRLLLQLLRSRRDTFLLCADADASAAAENDAVACMRKMRVCLTDAAVAALHAGDCSVHAKLVQRVRAVIAHRSSGNRSVLVACVASDEQVAAVAAWAPTELWLIVLFRCSIFCAGKRCSK